MAETPAGQRNIGTAEAPLYVPIGSAGDLNYTQNIQPNVASGVLNPTGTGPTGVTSSSGDTRAAIDGLGGKITKAEDTPSIPPPTPPNNKDLETAKAEGDKLIEDRRTALQRRRDDAIIGINASFDTLKDQTQEAQKSETGTKSMGLARTGGYLGGGASQDNVLIKLEQTHRRELVQMESQRQAALMQARNAYEDKDFELAQAKLANAEAIRKEIEGRKNNYDNYVLNYAANKRADSQFEFTKQEAKKKQVADNRKFLLDNGITSPFYTLDGQRVINAETGDVIATPEDYRAQGGKGDFSDVQKIDMSQYEASSTIQVVGGRVVKYSFDKKGNLLRSMDLGEAPNKYVSTTDLYGNPIAFNSTTGKYEGINGVEIGNNLKSDNYVSNVGKITGYGSSLWDKGLDIDLVKGAKVPTAVNGEVVFAGVNGGFGKQVQVKDAQGNVVWYSHLDDIKVGVGDKIVAGSILGLGGNTGNVIPGKGGDGSHLDITIKKADGSYMSPREVEAYVNKQFSSSYTSPSSGPEKVTPLTALGKLQDVVNNLNVGGVAWASVPGELKTFIRIKQEKDNNIGSDTYGQIITSYVMNEPSQKQLGQLADIINKIQETAKKDISDDATAQAIQMGRAENMTDEEIIKDLVNSGMDEGLAREKVKKTPKDATSSGSGSSTQNQNLSFEQMAQLAQAGSLDEEIVRQAYKNKKIDDRQLKFLLDNQMMNSGIFGFFGKVAKIGDGLFGGSSNAGR